MLKTALNLLFGLKICLRLLLPIFLLALIVLGCMLDVFRAQLAENDALIASIDAYFS